MHRSHETWVYYTFEYRFHGIPILRLTIRAHKGVRRLGQTHPLLQSVMFEYLYLKASPSIKALLVRHDFHAYVRFPAFEL